jgi:hypothetical protein
MTKRRYSDAADSNAGDDFHVLWTMRKCIDLINFNEDGLKAVAVENLSANDYIYTGADPAMFLGVDLTEYYGGISIDTASSIIISQLKYSTRDPDLNWTLNNICTGKKIDHDGSIVHRLGSIYTGLAKKVDSKTLATKLKIQLVSNRPAGQELTDLLNDIQSKIQLQRAGTKKLTFANLKKNQDIAFIDAVDKLKLASGLSAEAFLEFITLFSLDNCGVPSRFQTEQKLIEAITAYTSFNESQEFDYLNKLINSKMLPDNAQTNTIKRSDVLLAFNLPDIDYVFPVPNQIEEPEKLVIREQLPKIITEILSVENSLLCLHGVAGIGKSTLMDSIADNLPQGSVSVVLDCYGGGSYLNSNDGRHNYEQAITQLCNELAIFTGSNLLLKRNQDDLFYIKELRRRMESASLIIKDFHKDALVVLIIDAADNSITAAEKYDTTSFVSGLLEMSIPKGCKVILSTRTGRMDSLNLPKKVKKIEIKPFVVEETGRFLAAKFPNISDNEITEFHQLTFGIPRVMVYTIELDGFTLTEKINTIKPNGRNLNEIFKLQIEQAERKSSEKEVSIFLQRVISLPRPVPLDVLIATCETSAEKIVDIRTDLWSGMIFRDDKFSFRDEDLENYIREEYPPSIADDNVIAEKLLLMAESNSYASSHLGRFLAKSNRYRELSEIVIEKLLLAYPQDPIKNKEVFIERTRLAMRSADTNRDLLNLLKLQIVAAEAAKTNKVLEDILLETPELAASYGNLETNEKVYFQSGNPSWFGPAHFMNAAIYAKTEPTHQLAKSHLKKADEWLSYRSKLSEEDAKDYDVTHVDIAYGMEAIYYLEGIEKAVEWVRAWTPLTITYNAICSFVNRVLSIGPSKDIYEWVKMNPKLRIDLKIMVGAFYYRYGYESPIKFSDVKDSIPLIQRIILNAETNFQNFLVGFCEFCLMDGEDYTEISLLLDAMPDYTPSRVPGFSDSSFRGDVTEPDIFFRIQAMRHLFTNSGYSPIDLFPKSVLDQADDDGKKKSRKEEERTEFTRVYKYILPVYLSRAKYIIKGETRKEAMKEAISQTISVFNDWEIGHYMSYRASSLRKFIVLKLTDLDFVSGQNEYISEILKNIDFKETSYVDLFISIGEKISKREELRGIIPEILSKAELRIESEILAGSEILKYYSRSSIVASRLSGTLGKYYFDKMVLASNEIDLEAHDQVRAVSEMVKDEELRDSPALAHLFARYVKFCSEKLKGWDGFPWYVVFPALNNLDFATSFSRLCQWDDSGIKDWEKHFFDLLENAFSNGYIGADEAIGMFGMNKYQIVELIPVYEKLLEQIDLRKNSALKNAAVQIISRDMMLNFAPGQGSGAIRGFYNLISDGKFLNLGNVQKFGEFLTEVEKLQEKHNQPEKRDSDSENEHRTRYAELVKKIDATDQKIIKTIFEELRNDGGKKWIDYEMVFTILSEEKDDLKRLKILGELVSFDADFFSYSNFETGLSLLLKSWSTSAEVKIWKANIFEVIIKNWFDIFFGHDYFSRDTTKRLAEILDVAAINMAGTLMKLIPDHLDDFSSPTLYQLLETTSTLLEKGQKAIFIEWLFNRWNESIPAHFETMPFEDSENTPSKNVVPNMLRYFLGHPRKSLRWLACHVIRRLFKMGNTEILDTLLKLQNNTDCKPFQDSGHTYFWISAKLYLWIAISRVSKESPHIMIIFRDFFIQEIDNTELPHTLIKMHVREAALELERHLAGTFTQAELQRITGILDSGLTSVKKNKDARRKSNQEAEDTRFDFDAMDTLPYWYDSLGKPFDVSAAEVAVLADKYVSEKWGYVGNTREDNHVISSDYSDLSNRHGSEPRAEDLALYYEFHAMFCAASDLLLSKPLIESDSFYPRSWPEWIRQWGTYWEDRWLSDLRDATLFNPRYWRERKSGSDWEWEINEEDFNEILAIGVEDSITVFHGGNIHYGKDYEDISLRSGLIKPELGDSLLRCMQTFDSFDNFIPLEGSEIDEDEDTIPNEFQIQGWIASENMENRETDVFDPLVKEMDKHKIVPGKAFMSWANASLSEDWRTTYHQEDKNNWLTKLTRWSNTPRKISYSDFTSDGVNLQIRSAVLMDFLKAENKSLIIKVELKRNRERREGEYYAPYSKIYLVEANGRITTTTGNYQLR